MSVFNTTTSQKYNILQNIVKPYKKEFTFIGPFAKLMGSNNQSAVWGKSMENGGSGRDVGERVIYNKQRVYAPTVSTGNTYNTTLITNNAESIFMATDDIKLQKFRFDSKILNREWDTQLTGHDFWNEVKYDLLQKGRLLQENRYKNSLVNAFSGNGNGNDGSNTTTLMTPAQITAAMAVGSFNAADNTQLSGDRFMFGQAGAGAGNTVADRATAIAAAADAAGNQLTAETLYNLSVLAAQGEHTVTAVRQERIEPHTYTNFKGFERRKYVLFTSNAAFGTLRQDEDWIGQQTRGVIEDPCQPSLLFGSDYRGTLYGIDVVTDPMFDSMIMHEAANGNARVMYSVLVGAGALGYAMGKEPILKVEESFDYGNIKGVAHVETSGIKVLKFPARTDVAANKGQNVHPFLENGLIHVGTTLPIAP